MAIGDYILCCKCEVKLIYDGDRDQREWWEERFGKEPEIECPNCKPQRTWVELTDEQIEDCYKQGGIGRAIQLFKEKNT
jgi:hydrogenase maturation factor HypF (carbamoyltransferase family)